jgi:cell division protein FtsW (lipid II flippase)
VLPRVACDLACGLLRRSLSFVAILVAALVLVSDWPLGWAGWTEHPYLAAFAAGLVLLLLTGSVVDVILRRREARRWIDLGRGAAYALDQVFFLSEIAMFQRLGTIAQQPPALQVADCTKPER